MVHNNFSFRFQTTITETKKAVFNEENGLFDIWLNRLDNCNNLPDSFQDKSKPLKTEPSLKIKKKSPLGAAEKSKI